MWRSVATKSRQVLPRKIGATHNTTSKVTASEALVSYTLSQSHYFSTRVLSRTYFSGEKLRFFSNLSTNWTGTEVDHEHNDNWASVNDSSSVLGENNDTQLENLGPVNDLEGLSDEKVSSITENGHSLMEKSEAWDEGVVESVGEGQREEEDVGVYEIDMERLENVLSLLRGSVDGSLESSLNDMELDLHEEFVVKVLEAPHIPGANLIRFFKWAAEFSGISISLRLVDAIVQALSSDLRRKDVYALWDLIRVMGEKNSAVVNVETLDKLISIFSVLGKGKAAYEVFNRFEDFGCVANSDTYYYTIEALCRRSFFDWASSVSEKMIAAGALPDSERVGKLITYFSKGSKAKEAHSIYMLAKERNSFPPQSSVNFLIGSLSTKDETVKLAREMLDDFPVEARRRAIKPFSSVIRGLCRIKDVEGAKKLLVEMISHGPPPGNAVFNTVIHGFSKSGDIKEAIETMTLMESRGLKPDVYTYTVVIGGYVSGGQMEEASKILLEAKKKHSKLSPVTYHTLIRGYCKLELFDQALQLLAEMKEFGVQPNVDEYNKLIQSLCLRALDWDKAEKLLEEMKSNGLHLNAITQGLIRAIKELEEEGLKEVCTGA